MLACQVQARPVAKQAMSCSNKHSISKTSRPGPVKKLDANVALLASGAKLPEGETPSLKSVPFLGALVKMEEDVDTLSRHASRPADVRTAGHRFFR